MCPLCPNPRLGTRGAPTRQKCSHRQAEQSARSLSVEYDKRRTYDVHQDLLILVVLTFDHRAMSASSSNTVKTKAKPLSIVPGRSSSSAVQIDDDDAGDDDVQMADDDAPPCNQNVDSTQGDNGTASSSVHPAQNDDDQDAKPEFDDPNLLASYPIYLSHSVPSTSSLQLFQYPTYPNRAPLPLPNYSKERGLTHAIRWRPNAGWVQVELPLDLRAALYHKEKGEEMAKGADKMGGQIGSGDPAGNDAEDEDALPWARRRGNKKSSRAADSDEEMAGIGGAKGPSRKLEKMRLESEVMPHMTKYCVGVMRDRE